MGVVNVEVTMDALSKNLNRGFGFITFATIEACKAAHAQCHSQRLKILVSCCLFLFVGVINVGRWGISLA